MVEMVRIVSDHSGLVISCCRSCCPLAQSTGTPSFKVGYLGDGQLKSQITWIYSMFCSSFVIIQNEWIPTIYYLLPLYIYIICTSIYIYKYIYIYIFAPCTWCGRKLRMVRKVSLILLQKICGNITLQTWEICKLLFENNGQRWSIELSQARYFFSKYLTESSPKKGI